MNFSIIAVTGTLYFTLPPKVMKAKWSARGYDSFQLRDTGSVRFAIRQIRSPFIQMQNGFTVAARGGALRIGKVRTEAGKQDAIAFAAETGLKPGKTFAADGQGGKQSPP